MICSTASLLIKTSKSAILNFSRGQISEEVSVPLTFGFDPEKRTGKFWTANSGPLILDLIWTAALFGMARSESAHNAACGFTDLAHVNLDGGFISLSGRNRVVSYTDIPNHCQLT